MDQMQLVADILQLLDQQHGITHVNTRQMNAVITAANTICDAMEKPHTEAKAECGLDSWLHSDSTGLSSLAMAWHLFPHPEDRQKVGYRLKMNDRDSHPWDPSDFGRCYRFLQAVPEAKSRLDKMRSVSAVWERLITHWDEMTALYERDFPTGKSDDLYKLMQKLISNR